jgi:hypothetical protein
VLSILAALVAAWLAIACEQVVRGGAGTVVGVPFVGLELSPRYVVRAVQGRSGSLGPGAWAFVVLAGTVALLAGALAVHFAVGLLRASGWLRSLALELAVIALLWPPTALVAAALPGGGGPVAELYGRLGDPQAGRWAAGALALVLLWLVGRAVSTRAVAVGRAWMRADAIEFRRRLVRVVAGYPAAAGLVAAVLVSGWMAPGWIAAWAGLVLAVLMARTP